MSDTGSGMSPEVQEHMFEPFYTTKDPGRGTGLGLSMVYRCIESHRGWISVSSEEDLGSTFCLNIPLEEVAAQSRPAGAAVEVPTGSETLLLVDDTDAVLFLGRGILERCGYQVRIAWDGEEALEIYQQAPGEIALVVTDLVMPRAGGRELLQGLRNRGERVPVVLTTGYAIDGRREEFLREGFAALVTKPFDLATLARTVRQVLDEDIAP